VKGQIQNVGRAEEKGWKLDKMAGCGQTRTNVRRATRTLPNGRAHYVRPTSHPDIVGEVSALYGVTGKLNADGEVQKEPKARAYNHAVAAFHLGRRVILRVTRCYSYLRPMSR
jgi:hypothetical protein